MTDFLITGGSGFVGANLARVLSLRGRVVVTCFRAPAPDGLTSAQVDICDEEAVAAVWERFKPKAVIHAAGNKNVKFCEENLEEAARTNSLGTRNVARACRGVGAKLVYISTDVVFDCLRGGYQESDTPRPSLVYGKTKLAGEQWARAECPDAAICRTGGVYGKSSPLLKWLGGELSKGLTVKGFTDVVNTPTYVDNLAEMIGALLRRNLSGVFHTVGIQRVSRYQLFRSFARVFGLEEALVQPEEVGDRRASLLLLADSSLSVAKTAPLLDVPFNSVDEGLERLRRDGGL